MVVNPKTLLQYALRKQNKISHVPCETLVFAKDEIPEGILKKIEKQYSSDFLDDADFVSFTKGPIDKDMIKKLFKATDKALGEEANKLTEGDFKLLKMKETDTELEDVEDPGDETPDSEIEAIVGGEDNSEDEDSDENEVDADNEETIGDVLDDSADEDIEESEEVDEAGMSLDDILMKGNDIAARRNAEVAAADAQKHEQKIKQIWVKSINVDTQNENNSYAPLEITYADGKVEDFDFPIGTTGNDSNFKGKDELRAYAVAGERYQQGDAAYKQTMQNLKRAFAKYHIEPTDEDVRIAGIRNAFNDYRIKWLYGKDKKDDPMFAFSRSETQAKTDNDFLNAVSKKSMSKIAALRNKDQVGASTSKGRVVYKNGNTTIYKANEAEENDSIYARMHQGKSMAQWEKEFKGEFDVNQLWRMATSGCDLQKLLLQINNTITIEDSEKQMNEAKEEKKEDAEEQTSDDSEEKDETNDTSSEDSETDDSKASDDADKGSNPSGVAAEKSDVPTKWVFLKITIKK